MRVGCAAYLLYKVWGQKKKVHELCDLLYTPVKKEQMISMSPEPADEKEVMGKTRFVYLDENAGKTVAPYMSQPLEMSADYIGEEDEIQDGEVECNLSLEEMELLRKEQEELDGMAPEAVAVTQAVTADDLSLAGDVLMKVDGADRDVEKVCRAARTLFLLRGTCLFDLLVSQTGNMEAVTRLLEENLDENGQPLARKGKKGEFDWKTLVARLK